MATDARNDIQIEVTLSQLEADLADMPDLAKEWAKMDESARAIFEMEWSISMFDWLPFLDREYRQGKLSSVQVSRYKRLLAKLKELTPVINQLGFSQPTINLGLGEAA